MRETFEDVVEMIRQYPPEQQDLLVELIRSWRIESRRREIARDAAVSLDAYRTGVLSPQAADTIIAHLREPLESEE